MNGPARYRTEEQVRHELQRLAAQAGGVMQLAKSWRISRPYLHEVISGRNVPSDRILRRLKLRRVVLYLGQR